MAYKKVKGHGIVLYPESAPDNWQEVVTSVDIPVAWALHDKDKQKDGTLKKPHIHVYFFRPLSKKIQSFIIKSLGFENLYFEQLYDLYGTYHYLWHDTENAKDKYQYDKSIVGSSENFYEDDYPKTIETEDVSDILYKIIIANNFYELCDLYDYVSDNEIEFDGVPAKDVAKYIRNNSYFVNSLLTSRRSKKGAGNDNSRNISHI